MITTEDAVDTAKDWLRKALEAIEVDPVRARMDCLSAVATLDSCRDLTSRPTGEKCRSRKGEMIPLDNWGVRRTR
jgi:hypothetical protein